MSGPPAGWHPDPDDPNQWRYWDGERWTDQRAPRFQQPPPPPHDPAPDVPGWYDDPDDPESERWSDGSAWRGRRRKSEWNDQPSRRRAPWGWIAAAAAIAIFALFGSASLETDVSEQCEGSMRRAAAEPDSTKADPLIRATLTACSSADEWLAALELHPGAMGLNERAEIGEMDLQVACFGYENTRVCRDAAERGML